MEYIEVTNANIGSEHICCAISDKKCVNGYNEKKEWLKEEFKYGYKFLRLNERAKVFIEYGPAEYGWAPIEAKNYTLINCFWVSGKYKGHGHGKNLLNMAQNDAKKLGHYGLVTVVGKKKFHFMSDSKFLKLQGFAQVDESKDGFILLAKKFGNSFPNPSFSNSVNQGIGDNEDLVVYYSNRCPFTVHYVNTELLKTAKQRGLSLKVIKLEDYKSAQNAPIPATIFSLFYKGEFITTDVSICLDNRFEKILNKSINR